MSIALKDENLYDESLVKIIRVTEKGIHASELEELKFLSDAIIKGRLDVISLVLDGDTQYTSGLNDLIIQQLDQVFGHLCKDEAFAFRQRNGNYAGLHVDGQLGPDRKYLNFVDIRVHCSPGSFQDRNLPEGANPTDFDPFFLFGRVKDLQVYPETLTQSYETFNATYAVNLNHPVWNIFRAHGRLESRAVNAPVAHAVVPRKMAEVLLDPETEFTPLANGDYQQARLAGKTYRITPFEETPFRDANGKAYGVERTYDLVNYPVGPTRDFARSLVA